MRFNLFAVPRHQFFYGFRIWKCYIFRITTAGNGFQIFRTHDSAHAGSAVGMAQRVHHIGQQHETLAGGSDGRHPCFGVSHLFPDFIQGITVFKAPYRTGIPDLNLPMPDLSAYPKTDCSAVLGEAIITGDDGSEETPSGEETGLEETPPEEEPEEVGTESDLEGEFTTEAEETDEEPQTTSWLWLIIILIIIIVVLYVLYKATKKVKR